MRVRCLAILSRIQGVILTIYLTDECHRHEIGTQVPVHVKEEQVQYDTIYNSI